VLGVGLVQLLVETQQVLVQVRDASLLAAKLETYLRAFEGLLEKVFGQLVAGFHAGIELLGHRALRLQSAALCQRPASGGHSFGRSLKRRSLSSPPGSSCGRFSSKP